jgi:hypothetical protein
MGRQKGKNQVVVYLAPELHRGLRLQAARVGRSMSDLVEQALRAQAGQESPRVQLPRPPEPPIPEVVEALAAHGAPLWSGGRRTEGSLEQTVAAGLTAARRHPSLLRVLPVLLWRNRARLSLARLRDAAGADGQRPLGMLIDLTAEVTRWERFHRWADRIRASVTVPDPPQAFFEPGATGQRYLELARLRTPAVIRRWGYLVATPLDDFQEAVNRFCPARRSSIAPI